MIEATYREICCSEAALFPMSRPPPDFPITATSVRDPLHVLEGRWTLQIILCLSTGDLRFSDLRVALPVIDRKSVVEGKSVSVRVDLGGRWILKKQKQKLNTRTT